MGCCVSVFAAFGGAADSTCAGLLSFLQTYARIHVGWFDRTCSLLQQPPPLTVERRSAVVCFGVVAGIPGPRGWDPRCAPPAGVGGGSEERKQKKSPLLTFGLIVDATFAGRLVDKGPPAEDGPAARKFRQFWGDKSELRRYRTFVALSGSCSVPLFACMIPVVLGHRSLCPGGVLVLSLFPPFAARSCAFPFCDTPS